MRRFLMLLLAVGFASAMAQDADTDDSATTTEPSATEAESDATSEDLYEDDFELDLGTDDHLEDDEDVFEASVEVSYQQSVSFPTDI